MSESLPTPSAATTTSTVATSGAASLMPQRVQIKLRGVRFETSIEVLSAYCGTFQRFFNSRVAMEAPIVPCVDPRAPPSDSVGEGDEMARLAAKTALLSAFYDALPSSAVAHKPPIRFIGKVLSTSSHGGTLGQEMWAIDFSVRKDDEKGVSAPKDELQPDFAGSIFVFLRKLHAVGGDASRAKFSARWDEMPFDQQRSLSDIVRVFDIAVLLQRGFGAPTADPHTAVDDSCNANAGVLLPGEAPGGMVDKALEYMTTQQHVVGVPHPSIDDDALELPTCGCAKCGVSGHTTGECPY